jgi:hypothetical protein
MRHHRTTRTIRAGRSVAGIAITVAVTVGLATAPTSTASAAATTDPAYVGLFGSQDPTYDGVYRQSLSLLVLDAAGARIPAASVAWLHRQQCGNGSFMSFRSNLDRPCRAKDSNATALAVMAYQRLGERKRARDAVQWLIAHQDRSGGWEYTAGWGPDSNSTGLVVQALIAMKIKPASVTKRGKSGLDFLRKVQLDCDSAKVKTRGALDYQRESPLVANDFATAQATAALARSPLPVQPRAASTERPAFACDGSTEPSAAAAAAGYLGRLIRSTGGYIPSFDASPDYGSTANAVLSLVAAGYASNQIVKATDTLSAVASDFTRGSKGNVIPAAAASLALVAIATGGDPRSFGGTNPVRDIQQSRTKRG